MLASHMVNVLVQAPVNIALIKYWGKRNEQLILPLNDSVSLSIDELKAETRVSVEPNNEEHRVFINGNLIDQKHLARFNRVIKELINILNQKRVTSQNKAIKESWHVEVHSQTNFPIAAGLASSAAGFAAIAFGLGHLFNLSIDNVIRLARIGSGSACRSVLSGFVHWKAGTSDSDCTCETLAPPDHWPELRAIIIVVSNKQKKISSSEGMRNTVSTSGLLGTRTKELVPRRVKILTQAIETKDFPKFAEITMAESNELHAICLDTYPPIIYLNETSHALMEFVHDFNAQFGTKLAYTFDAGPSCCLFLEESDLPSFKQTFKDCFSFDSSSKLWDVTAKENNVDGNPTMVESRTDGFPWTERRKIHIERIIVSTIGMGPRVLELISDSQSERVNDGNTQ